MNEQNELYFSGYFYQQGHVYGIMQRCLFLM